MRYVQRSGCLEDARPCFSHCFRIKADEWKWCGNAIQLTVFRRCVVKNVMLKNMELCSRSPTGRGVRLKSGSVRVRISSGILRDRDERKT